MNGELYENIKKWIEYIKECSLQKVKRWTEYYREFSLLNTAMHFRKI
jgi:hypothetical protein